MEGIVKFEERRVDVKQSTHEICGLKHEVSLLIMAI